MGPITKKTMTLTTPSQGNCSKLYLEWTSEEFTELLWPQVPPFTNID